jgi:segregation and condensation protein A
MAEYKVQFEVFEGPLDLLLYLVKKEEVDIYQINLTKLATQFIEYVELMREFDLDIAGEFLVMASTLMYIKSRELLPVEQRETASTDEDEGEDPRWELIRKLVEYKKFKDAAGELQQLEHRQENVFARQPVKPEFEAAAPRTEVTLFDLVSAVSAILKRFQTRTDTRDIFEDKWSVSEKIEFVRNTLTSRSRVRFSELFAATTSRTEVVVTFLALLELIRLKVLVALQAETFGDIDLSLAPPLEPGSVAAGTAIPVEVPSEPQPSSSEPLAAEPPTTQA